MKKLFLLSAICCILFSSFAFAEEYRISQVNYDIKGSGPKFIGATKKYALEQNVPVDTEKVFSSQEEVEQYVLDYIMRLNNTRNFETINVTYDYNPDFTVTLNVEVQDSFHMILIPYGRYDSNKGLVFKLKINFMFL